ncbi:ankyrin repeat domain-containing protein 39-like [Halichondria panicea]|uniref:ankyrin repeat domain-containing protein 39-like n=1 Tax=Halichondria panicea TaxID=6063 RepID=UPI00312B6F5D
MEQASDGHSCACALQSSGVEQSLQELEFERGIWSAALDGDIVRLRGLLSSGVSPTVLDSAGYTALHYASRCGHREVCECLLLSGADVNSQTPGGVTPLHRAAYCGHLSLVETLLQNKADPKLKDSDGRNALHKAAQGGHYRVAKMLVSSLPALINTRDKRELLPAEIVKNSNTQWTKLLTEHIS